MKKLPESDFISRLVDMNHLGRFGFDRFVFFPGMLFLTFETWWGKNKIRNTAHEGLDICFFINTRQDQFRLDETARIPILFEGRMVHMMEDFLGQTIVVRHHSDGVDQKRLLSFYAHIMPDHRLRMGDIIQPDQTLGTIADPKMVNSPLAPHVHVSLAWESMLPQTSMLTWKLLNQADRSAFIDPLEVMSGAYSIIENAPDEHIINNFIKCSSVLKED